MKRKITIGDGKEIYSIETIDGKYLTELKYDKYNRKHTKRSSSVYFLEKRELFDILEFKGIKSIPECDNNGVSKISDLSIRKYTIRIYPVASNIDGYEELLFYKTLKNT